MTRSLQPYQTLFDQASPLLPGNHTAQIRQFREQALTHFLQTGFPTTRDEEWRYTSLRQIEQTSFELALHQTHSSILTTQAKTLLQKTIDQSQWENLVQWVAINGQWLPHANTQFDQPAPYSHSLAQLLNTEPERLIPWLNQTFDPYPHALISLNSALMHDGIFIHVPENQTITIHLIFLTTAGETPLACHLRNLIVLDKNATATVIESYLGNDEQHYLTNTVTEIHLGEKATLTHYKLQQEGKKAFHFGTVYAKQADSNSQFANHTISLGGLLSRSDTHIQLDAPMTHCLLNGLYHLSDHQHMDHHTSIHHLKPQGTSQEFYKGILSGNARGVFNGKVLVYQDAQKTDSAQYNQNLLLSETAEIDTKPQLEIFADDVKCVHGATVGQLDEVALFYLRSRGLDLETARQLLIEAFFNDVLTRIPHLLLREQVTRCL